MRDPHQIAQDAQLAMLLELSCSPKPGNVDRCHDHDDIHFHHFLVSSVLAYPIFLEAAQLGHGVGRLLLKAALSWKDWGLKDNLHFGEMVLLLPLVMAARNPANLRGELAGILRSATTEDAVEFYRAFGLVNPRVSEVGELSLNKPQSRERIKAEGLTLLQLMRLSQGHDLIAREWATCYHRSFHLSHRIVDLIPSAGLNDAVVIAFLEALAEVPDSLVASKFGETTAREVSGMAIEVLEGEDVLAGAEEMDRQLQAEGINPGSTADLIASAIFIALAEGARF